MTLGQRQFAYVGVEHASSFAQRDSLAKELRRHGFDLQSAETTSIFARPHEECDRIEQAVPAIVELVRRAKEPLAVATTDDSHAVVVCRIAKWLGLRIPDDVAVLCMRDSSLARINDPPISSVRAPGEEVGFQAARILHRLMDGRRLSSKNTRVPVREIIVRESTASPERSASGNMNRALELIRNQACEGLRVSDVARQMTMGVRTFELHFAATVGHSVGDESRRARLARAKDLLNTTTLPLSRIATLVGLSDGPSLTRFFRQHTSQTPSGFRRNGRAAANAQQEGCNATPKLHTSRTNAK